MAGMLKFSWSIGSKTGKCFLTISVLIFQKWGWWKCNNLWVLFQQLMHPHLGNMEMILGPSGKISKCSLKSSPAVPMFMFIPPISWGQKQFFVLFWNEHALKHLGLPKMCSIYMLRWFSFANFSGQIGWHNF